MLLIGGSNDAYTNIVASFLKVGDDSMSVSRFRTKVKGNLLHLYYISHNATGDRVQDCGVFCYFGIDHHWDTER